MNFKLLITIQILLVLVVAIALGAWIPWLGIAYAVLCAIGFVASWPFLRDSAALCNALHAELSSDTTSVDLCDVATFENNHVKTPAPTKKRYNTACDFEIKHERVNHLEEPIWMRTSNLEEPK